MTPILSTLPNLRNELLKVPYAAIDLEWKFHPNNKTKPYTLYAASIVDSDGKTHAKHIMNFSSSEPEKELAIWFIRKVLQYQLTIGWYSKGVRIQKDDGTWKGKDSDLKVLDIVCQYYKIPSIIIFDQRGNPYVQGYDLPSFKISSYNASLNKHSYYYHIDLFRVYKKPFVRFMIYQNKYKDLSLDAVSKAILGEGKYRNLDGIEIQKMTKQEQLEYVAQDARLVMKLSQHENFKLLDIMNAISCITHIAFDKVCHTEISTWWTRMIEDAIISGTCRPTYKQISKRKYSGGYVLDPKVAFYNKKSVYVLDVKSLYPSMMITNNISFETVNCKCCTDDPEAWVQVRVMDLINCNLPNEEKRERYWVCRSLNYRGIIPRLLEQFREERFRQKELGNESMQLALKNLINGCYGLFGADFFQYSDFRVAELTTAFGREALQYMQYIAKEVYGFDIIYGDTDSIFITDVNEEIDIKKFIAECYIMLDIDVEQSKIYSKFLITKKKHYIGINQDEQKEPDIKGMEGIKKDRPIWINRIERQFAEDIKHGKDPTINLRDQYKAMESGLVPLEELGINLTLTKNPSEYPENSLQRLLGSESDTNEGDIIRYYKSESIGGGTSKPNLISRKKYLEMLGTTVGDALTSMGYDYKRDIIGCRKILDYK
jgi:DNA polymerase elongation subunit (family B)